MLTNANMNMPYDKSSLFRLCSLDSALAVEIMRNEYPNITPWHAWHVLQAQADVKRLVLSYVESFLSVHFMSERYM